MEGIDPEDLARELPCEESTRCHRVRRVDHAMAVPGRPFSAWASEEAAEQTPTVLR